MVAERQFKYLDLLTTAFVVMLLVSNLLAQKICRIGPFAVSGAVLLFRCDQGLIARRKASAEWVASSKCCIRGMGLLS